MADHRTQRLSSQAFVGRSSECAALDHVLGQVRSGHSAVLVVRGEAGIGKTALLRYLTKAATGFTIVRCAGVESEMELPFAGLHELCSPLLEGLNSLPEPQQRALNVALGLESGQSPDKFLVALGALGLLATASEKGLILCVVEDAHWLDHASAQGLGLIGRRLLAEPVGLVFAARPSETTPDPLARLPELHVEGLDRRSAQSLLNSVIPTPVDQSVSARIIDETQGNPLALLELGEHMGAGFAGGYSSVGNASVSHRIEEEYVARLSAVPERTQLFLLLAAADPIGETTLLQRAAGKLALGVDAAQPAIEAGLISVGTAVRFRHPLLRSAVYRSANDERRRTAHAALAAETDPDADPDRRAWHRAYAASAPDEEVAIELITSADRAQARGGVAAAAAFWERAVVLTPAPADRASRALVAAQAKFTVGDFKSSRRLLGEAESGLASELQEAEVDRLRGQIEFGSRRSGDSPPLLFKAAKRLETIDLELARQTYLQALVASAYAGPSLDQEIRHEIGRAAQALPLDSAPTPAIQLLVYGLATRMLNGYVAAAPVIKSVVRQYCNGQLEPGWVSVSACALAIELCDDDAWYAIVNQQAEAARREGMFSWLPFALDFLAEFYVNAGQLAQAEALLHELSRIDPNGTAKRALPIALLVAGWRGDAPLASTLAHNLSEVKAHGSVQTVANYAKAVLFNGLADYSAALDTATSASEEDFFHISIWSLYELVEAAARCDELGRGRRAADQLVEVANASGTDFACGLAARSQALLAEGQAADALYRDAIERLGRTRMTAHLARARLSYGEWLRRKGRRIDARTQLRPAHAALVAMGAHGFAERARRELKATGEKVRKRTEETANELTTQEEQIAQLARERRTNPEIGAQLFLSARTVEWHLRKIYAKLDIKSRRELDAALARRDKPNLTA
jgi:DNA-binding CsgD family transcriptional regulator